MHNTPSPGRWGPAGCAAAVSVTFDNLGEATELERGTWPKDMPLGQHFSVTRALPAILKMLVEIDLAATFFIEGLNTQLYPDAILKIRALGHEVAYHGWRHEEWHRLEYAQEAQLFARGMREMEKLGVKLYGFRPPGGKLTPSSIELLKERNFTYCSPAGSPIARFSDGFVSLPFQWQVIDAYCYLPHFSSLREMYGEAHDPLPPSHLNHTVRSALRKSVQNGSYLSLLFHPFLEESQERFTVMRSLLAELQRLVHDGSVWCAPCYKVADWMLGHPTDFDAANFAES